MRMRYLISQKTQYPPHSRELNIIMKNKVLFNFYATMIAEDYKKDFEKAKFVGLLTNPEGYHQIIPKIERKDTFSSEDYNPQSGIELTKKLRDENEKYNLYKHLNTVSEEGIEMI